MEELSVIETTSGRQFKPWVDADKLLEIVQDPASVTGIASEIASGKQAIAAAINGKGGSASATESFTELAQAVEEIPNYSDMVKLAGIIAGGNYDKNALQGHNENVKYGKTEIIDNVGAFKTINVAYCFRYWDLLDNVKLPSLTTISYGYLFQFCSSLQKFELPNLTTISGVYVFQGCSSLQKIELPNLTTISGTYVFAHCSSLQEIELPNLTTISGTYVFARCSSLQKIELPNLTTISGTYVFQFCSSLQEIELPSLTTISGYVFQDCSSLQEIELPNLTTISGDHVFLYCYKLKIAKFPKCSQISGLPMFYNDSGLINVVLGTLTQISEPFYDGKPNLRNITIGQDTDVNLPFQSWTATNVINEGQSGIDELNTNLYSNLLTKLYDHSQDGETRTLRIGWLSRVTAENIAYANAKGWTLTT